VEGQEDVEGKSNRSYQHWQNFGEMCSSGLG